MVATYSPHRDGGGTLHFPSPTHLHHVDPTSALAQLRRSLSRSPSKGPTFRLVASKSTSPSPSSPLSPSHISPQKRAGSASMLSNASVISPSPLATPFPPSARKNRSGARRLSPMRPSTRSQSAQRSPAKRALSECTDNGNSSPDSPTEAGPGLENRSTRSNSLEDKSDMEVDMNLPDTVMSDNLLAPRHAMVRRGEGSGCLAEFCAKSSPLKRSDGIMNLDQANRGSPSAKRRSLHAASFSPDFDIFDHEAALAGQGQSEMPDSGHGANSDVPSFLDHTSVFASLPKRTFSLRKTTLQQRYEKPSFGRPRPNSDAMHGVTTPGQTASKGRLRMSLDNLLPQPPRDSPFCLQGGLPSASVHPMGPQRRDGQVAGLPSLPQRHPLSRTITQSSSSSSLAEDSPTHVPLRQPEARRPSVDFSKSLPVGAGRPVGRESSSQGSTTQSFTTEASFATPDNYKLAKPLPAAFMSTGLISKRNKDMSAVQLELQTGVGNMPDTPCKRSTNLVAVAPVPIAADDASKPRAERRSIHSFGTPSTPFNLHTSRPSLGSLPKGVSIFGSSFTKGNLSRRNSFVSVEGDDNSQSPSGKFDSQSSAECEIPPTPTKQALGSSSVQHERGSVIEGSMPSPRAFHNYESRGPSGPQSPLPDHFSSPLFDRIGQKSPHTPQESILPPDPSGLSISARGDGLVLQSLNEISNRTSVFPPATPTAPRESFMRLGKSRSSLAAGHPVPPAEVDPCLTSKFDKVEIIGTGEFSQVFRVAQKGDPKSHPEYFNMPIRRTSPRTLVPLQVWAVKKTRQAYIGPKDRQRKLREVEVLKALGTSDHTVQLFDSWENKDHLYIQTEYCEEGSLDLFLDQVGRKARLDDFRIWKIMLELSLGLKHIHSTGFIHLDLKPANVLITFEGVLKIGDFGLASTWPAPAGTDGEGDREYIGPEILMGLYDKPSDVFALGLIMLEIAANVMLPDNGASWQRLRSGDMSDVPSLTSSSENSAVLRDAAGKPLSRADSFEDFDAEHELEDEFGEPHARIPPGELAHEAPRFKLRRRGELAAPPSFMVDPHHEEALDKIVRWMISPLPGHRPVVDQILETAGVRWAATRRRAGATVYEGNWGPADEVLLDDAEMIDAD